MQPELPGVPYTREQAEIMIHKKRRLQDLNPDLAARLREKGLTEFYTLRDLDGWQDDEFRHRILSCMAAFKDYNTK